MGHFGAAPDVVARAPGRVNLIGEHTDYNLGLVFPAAINRQTLAAARRSGDDHIRIYAAQFAEMDAFGVDAIPPADGDWRDYVRGAIAAARKAGHQLHGFDMLIDGDVPLGSGLSSSAALEMAVLTALSALFAWTARPQDLALLGQKAENDFVGVACGIMDQYASALCKADHGLFLDCRSLEHRAIPLNLAENGIRIAILDTGTPRTLATAGYNQRRRECEEGVQRLEALLKRPLVSLRDVAPHEYLANEDALPMPLRSRIKHVIAENSRVLNAVEALERRQIVTFGRYMAMSHESLRSDYEVSSPELDRMVALVSAVSGVIGARMTGAGFGGCAVALVRQEAVQNLIPALEMYHADTGKEPCLWLTDAALGASVLPVSRLSESQT